MSFWTFTELCSRLQEMPRVLRLAARPRAELRGGRRRAGLGEDVRRQHRELGIVGGFPPLC